MKKRGLALFLSLVMVFSLSGLVYATAGVDEPGVAGIFIDAIQNITLNPAELIDMQQNGLEIPVTGYVQYFSATTGGKNPKMDKFLVKGQIWDQAANAGAGGWADDKTLINREAALISTGIRDGLNGREFTDAAFSKAEWEIYGTGQYRVYASATFTAGDTTDPAAEEFTVELVSPAITVYPMAAPNIAGIILEKEGVDPNQSTGKGKDRTQLNLITEVAHHMGPKTLFNGIEKSVMDGDEEVCNPAYWQAVLDFLNGYNGISVTYSLEDYMADLGAGGDEPSLPATSNWTIDVQFTLGPSMSYSVVMNVSGSTISGTLLQSGSPAPHTFSGTLVGQEFTGTWVSSSGPQYIGAIKWTFNPTFDGIVSGGVWDASTDPDPYKLYSGAITGGTMLP